MTKRILPLQDRTPRAKRSTLREQILTYFDFEIEAALKLGLTRRWWIEFQGLSLFCRLTERMFPWLPVSIPDHHNFSEPKEAKPYPRVATIDISNISIPPRFQGKGLFTAILQNVEQRAVQYRRVVYIENVFHERFQAFFRKRGYIELGGDFATQPSFYLPILRQGDYTMSFTNDHPISFAGRVERPIK